MCSLGVSLTFWAYYAFDNDNFAFAYFAFDRYYFAFAYYAFDKYYFAFAFTYHAFDKDIPVLFVKSLIYAAKTKTELEITVLVDFIYSYMFCIKRL